MLLNEVLALLEYPSKEMNPEVTNFQVDSRNILPGGIFFALKGKKIDGHTMLQSAKDQGAIAAIVDKDYKGPDFGLILVPVQDVQNSLNKMAKKKLQLMQNPLIIGITGSAGKTTTKEFTAQILSDSFKVAKNPRSYNSQITFPLNILNFPLDREVLVLEIGISALGEMEKLVNIAPPDIALITNISSAHCGNFPNGFDDIVKEKTGIFAHPKTKKIFSFPQVFSFCPKFLLDQKEIFYLTKEDQNGDFILIRKEKNKIYFQETNGPCILIPSPFTESHLVEDVFMAASIARTLHVPWEEICKQITNLKAVEKRFEKILIDGVLYINDTYNASPDSVLVALKNLPTPKKGGKTLCVLGEMRELGSFADSAYKMVAEESVKIADELFCYGEKTVPILEAFYKNKKPARLFTEKKEIAHALQEKTKAGDVVLVKGVNSQALWEVFDYLQKKDDSLSSVF